MTLDVIGTPDKDHVQVAVELEDGHQHCGAASRAGAMAREPVGGVEALAQTEDTLIDSVARAHVSVLARKYDNACEEESLRV